MKVNIDSPEIPADIKFVNGLTSVLLGIFLFLSLIFGIEYLIKNKIDNLNKISIKGDISHNDISSIRNNVISNLSGNFFNINLIKTKQFFETMPWINQAVVRRVYPNQIEVRLSEYKSKAVWGTREDMKLVDEAGSIFEANSEDDETDRIPQLIGPEGTGKLMLSMYQAISNVLDPLKMNLKILELNARGSWVVTLDSGAHIELGRGSLEEVMDRIRKFVIGAEQMLAKLGKKTVDVLYVDLRHSEGYALRMQGVSTLDMTTVNTSLKK